jgi:glycosyltransferase involved in cell wall biosynthesis
MYPVEWPESEGNDLLHAERSPASLSIDAIVPAYKAQCYIEKCIEGLFSAGFDARNIIVVDDCSPDTTAQQVRALGIEPITMETNCGPAEARNVGARASNADILLFVDCDVVIAPDTRSRLAVFFESRPDYAAVFGSYDSRPECTSPVSRFRNLLHRHVHIESAGEAVTFWTGCGAVRRDAFNQVGGFDSGQRMMEDVKLGLELHADGQRIWLDPSMQGKHLKRWTLSSMFHTDMIHRAIPWTRLLRTNIGKASSYALNLGWRGRISGLSVLGSIASLALMIAYPLAGALGIFAAFAVLITANASFLQMMQRECGWGEAALAVPLLWVHYLSACLGYAYARANS